ncbi:hypothetical protein JHK87_026951 [Glycine soja]|nr:hypothetical protein JHK87_026951 [Glycine soja]
MELLHDKYFSEEPPPVSVSELRVPLTKKGQDDLYVGWICRGAPSRHRLAWDTPFGYPRCGARKGLVGRDHRVGTWLSSEVEVIGREWLLVLEHKSVTKSQTLLLLAYPFSWNEERYLDSKGRYEVNCLCY